MSALSGFSTNWRGRRYAAQYAGSDKMLDDVDGAFSRRRSQPQFRRRFRVGQTRQGLDTVAVRVAGSHDDEAGLVAVRASQRRSGWNRRSPGPSQPIRGALVAALEMQTSHDFLAGV